MPFRTPIVGNGGSGPNPPGCATQTCIPNVDTSGISTGSGTAVYVSGNNDVAPTDNSAIATARFAGFFEGTGGEIIVGGVIGDAQFVTDDGAPTAGLPVYLAGASNDAGAGIGKLTPVVPSGSGTVITEVGICLDASGYAGGKTARVILQPKEPIVIP